ncbi:Riboflavin transporter RfnT [Paraburkholderia graminis C4D1M]|jgi:MFS family permease|uniref:Major facilitator superfamily MFS_1 n=2 Tax=Paraburkholderia TaxID=1822464 RepID=B1G9T4_PARG4|nr:MFS transporter [Paraburkholderia graminis]EDT07114.1 major facilitator superfamily MFS_1 [Paraburkholderia graminis C4D1M]CAB3738988.1 Riboflavin transporter RfnT [Paraburkholderia graminis C4D1M]
MATRKKEATSFDTGVRQSNAVVLSVAQGLYTAAVAIDLTLTGLTGYQLAPDKSLATLPFALITVASAIATLFASLLMQKIGRRRGFVIGAATGALGGLVSVWAILQNDFWWFCLGTAAVGIFQAFAQYYRLAAADSVAPQQKAKAISMVLAGGVIAAILGPALAAWSKNLFPTLFAGSYLMVFLLGVGSILVLVFGFRDVEAEIIPADEAAVARSLTTVFRQPISLAALANNVIGGVVMMFVMTAAPLAAVANHHSIDDGANIIQWHLVGMFAPSFVAGHLIKRYGMPSVLFAGMLLSAACTFIASASSSLPAFYVALLCLGIGWNFMFVGGTALLASSHTPAERAKVQGVAELVRNIFTAAASLVAGPILERFGWVNLNLVNVPLLVVAAALTVFWMRTERSSERVVSDSPAASR